MNTAMWIFIFLMWAFFGSVFWARMIQPMQPKIGITWTDIVVQIVSYAVLAGPIGIALMLVFAISSKILELKRGG